MSGGQATPRDSLSASQAEEVDRICIRFERAWRDGQRPRIEAVLAEAPAAARPALLRELLAVELELRRREGESPTLREYAERFSGEDALVAEAFGRERPTAGSEVAVTPPPRSRDDDGLNLLFGVLALQMDFISRAAL
ncbi:MAG TPA: hypothetical protein VFF52_30420 [Isosphaeraceae bacterium]|nr:hypothetical protein [Isosphaeraceae bacterium]